ncbi:type II toxin-antitoxin system death-on-curing family toxin [Sphingomonas kaistensis]|uniref:Type II toxin-antitoxin system death-on-curing family toxin n=1 Tax=Sphingomonas kaistensis TaxID=298708 RepID=A0ABZ2G5C8_9SPHN
MISYKNAAVADEAARWREKADTYQVSGSQQSLSLQDVLDVHFVIVDMFYGQSGGLGGVGPKDLGLLSSAVARQDSSFGGSARWDSLEEKVATLLYGIVLNHPFHDANKRTAFLAALYQLQSSGRYIKVSAELFENFLVSVAERSFRKMEKYQRTFKDTEDADVMYIAHVIRGITRHVDRRDYNITFRELDRVLKRFDYCLNNPQGNYIDVCRLDGNDAGHKVCQIGFPSWSKQVTRQGIKTIRQATNLDVLNGVDSQVFFKDVEPVSQLLARYHEPLVRLADR